MAINTATVLYHLREHLPQVHEKSRQQVANACPDYDLVADIVNASKHGELTRGSPQVAKAEDMEELLILTKYVDEKGYYFGSEHAVIVKLTNGDSRNLGEILTNVINYWCSEFHAMGIINNSVSFSYNTPVHPLTREEVESQKNDLKIIQGVRFRQAMKLQEYNYETGEVTPIDLTGSEIKMSFYKPPKHTLVINLKHNKSGKVISREIELSDEEYLELESLKTENEKQVYLSNIASRSGMMNELAVEANAVSQHNK